MFIAKSGFRIISGIVLAVTLALSAWPACCGSMESMKDAAFEVPSVPELRAAADGALAPAPSPAKKVSAQWVSGSFKSPVKSANIAYKYRMPYGAKETTVLAGGLALAESFESLFSAVPSRNNQFFLWFRAMPPSSWVYGRDNFEADARDLARFINLAAEKTGSRRVNLVLHSYSTLVVQKMVQMREDAEIGRALGYLRGAQVLMLNPTTHFKGSEALGGGNYAQTAAIISNFIKWLDMTDNYVDGWNSAAGLVPSMQAPVTFNLAMWEIQRNNALNMTSKQAREMMVDHLTPAWGGGLDPVRESLLGTVKKNVENPRWQETLLRRTDDTAKFDFVAADVAAMRSAGINLDFIYAGEDQLIPWAAERLTVAALFGIPVPEQLPQPGVVFRDQSGLFSLRVVQGDHYFPLKYPAELDKLIRK
jgi:hypothetical protein